MSVFLTAVACTAAATYGALRLAHRIGFVNVPNPLVPQHRKPVAYLGGVGLATGAAIAVSLWSGFLGVPRLIVIGAVLMLLLGVVDDGRPLSPAVKLAVQTVIAALTVPELVPRLTGVATLDAAVGIGWVLLVVNAVNLTDVCDGLVGGLAALAFAFLTLLGAYPPTFGWGLSGACVGFLMWNRPPARIFLGDAGSLMLGYLSATGVLLTVERQGVWPSAPAGLLVLVVFLLEFGLLVVARTRKGLPWWRGSPDHFALRLQHRGLSRASTIAGAWAVGAGAGVSACALRELGPAAQTGVLAGAAVVLALVWGRIAALPAPPATPRKPGWASDVGDRVMTSGPEHPSP